MAIMSTKGYHRTAKQDMVAFDPLHILQIHHVAFVALGKPRHAQISFCQSPLRKNCIVAVIIQQSTNTQLHYNRTIFLCKRQKEKPGKHTILKAFCEIGFRFDHLINSKKWGSKASQNPVINKVLFSPLSLLTILAVQIFHKFMHCCHRVAAPAQYDYMITV
ncbi:MAG: hypothetical protein LUF32_08390 [Clostridiales bacterium]|nr:hypothetical protein [Clostridiales bacterium]